MKSRRFIMPRWTRAAGSRLLADGEEGREARNPAVRELLVPENDGRSDGRRLLPLRVGEARPDRELDPARQADDERAEPPRVPALPRLVADHDRLVVLERLHLEERRRAACDVLRPGLPEHEP